jgi:hypothetical protein
MLDHVGIFKGIRLFLKRILGFGAFREVTAGSTLSERAYAVRAINGDATIDLVTQDGDDVSGVTLQQGASITGEFNEVSVDGGSSGSVLVYVL